MRKVVCMLCRLAHYWYDALSCYDSIPNAAIRFFSVYFCANFLAVLER